MTDLNETFAGPAAYTGPVSASDPEQGAALEERKFTIGELSRQFGVTLRALRFYENKGLIAPQRRGATRLYSSADRDRIAQILAGKRLGFTLAEIRRMVAGKTAERGGDLQLSREKCLEQIALLEEQRRGIEAGLAELRKIYARLPADTEELMAAAS